VDPESYFLENIWRKIYFLSSDKSLCGFVQTCRRVTT